MAKRNEDYIGMIEDVRKVIATDNEEFSSGSGLSPLKRYLKNFIKVDKFKNLNELTTKVVKMSIRGDSEMEDEYMSKMYSKMDEDSQDVLKDIIIDTYDHKQEDMAYARGVFQSQKILGLMRIEKKDLDDYDDRNGTFQERDVINKFVEKDLVNFHQSLNQTEMFKSLSNSMDSDFFNKLIEMLSEMKEGEKEIIMKLLGLADMASDLMGIIQSMAEVSAKISPERAGSVFEAPESDDDEEDEEEILEDIETSLVSHLIEMGYDKKDAKSEAEEIKETIEDADLEIEELHNIKFFLKKKHNALYTKKDMKEDIIAAMEITNIYFPHDEIEDSEKYKASSLILPIAYIARLTEETIGEIIDLSECDKEIINKKAEDDYDEDEIEGECEDLDEVVTLDITLGLNIATWLHGIEYKEDIYKDLAKKVIPKMTEEYLENIAEKEFSSEVSTNLVKKYLEKELRGYKDRPDLIIEIASAIMTALEL